MSDLISRIEVESVLHNNLHALIDTDQLYQLYKDINRLPTYSFTDSAENKGDLISRQAVLNLKQTFTDNAGYETEYVDVEDIKELTAIPSADIMECVRAIKEYCVNRVSHKPTMCDRCPMYKVMCEPDISCPYHWELPEGEKK